MGGFVWRNSAQELVSRSGAISSQQRELIGKEPERSRSLGSSGKFRSCVGETLCRIICRRSLVCGTSEELAHEARGAARNCELARSCESNKMMSPTEECSRRANASENA